MPSGMLSGFLTLPVGLALALCAGVAARQLGAPWWVVLGVCLAAVGVVLWRRLWLQHRWLLGVCLLGLPLGWARLELALRTPDAFAGRVGQNLVLVGESDGTFFASSEGRVLISPRLPAGRYRVRGRLENLVFYRNPGAFDYGAWLARRGVLHRVRITQETPLPGSWLGGVRAWLRAGAVAGLTSENAAFMLALTLGDTNALGALPDLEGAGASLSWRDVFSRSGLGHMLALSGQQVTLLVLVLSWVFLVFGRWRDPALVAFLGLYLLVVGPSPSITRAVLMGAAVVLARALGRGRLEVWPALGLSCVVALLFEPRWLFDAGFQLSYLAVMGLVLAGAALQQVQAALLLWPKWWRWLLTGLAATTGAQVLTLPLTASGFGVVPLFASFANLLVEPLAGVLVPLGFLAALCGPHLGAVFNAPIGILVTLLLWLARAFAQLPTLGWGAVSPVGMALTYGAVLLLGLACVRVVTWRLALLASLAVAALTAVAGATRQPAEVVFLDVGQGDASVLRLGGADILVDAGGSVRSDFDVGRRVVLPALRALGVRRLRALVATHADTDHIEGAIAVLERVPVGVLMVGHSKPRGEDALWDALLDVARKRGVAVQFVRRGEVWHIGGAGGGAALEFVGPKATPYPEDNWNSVGFVLRYGARRVLFLGDTPSELEDELHPGRLDVLKLAHHGSRFSTGAVLLGRTRPHAAVISAGVGNRYGHPTGAVLQRLQRQRVLVYRTDRDGAVRYDLRLGVFSVLAPNAATGQIGAPGR